MLTARMATKPVTQEFNVSLLLDVLEAVHPTSFTPADRV